MPYFSNKDIKEMEVANQIKSVLAAVHLNLGVDQPKAINASFDFETGELNYDLIPKTVEEAKK